MEDDKNNNGTVSISLANYTRVKRKLKEAQEKAAAVKKSNENKAVREENLSDGDLLSKMLNDHIKFIGKEDQDDSRNVKVPKNLVVNVPIQTVVNKVTKPERSAALQNIKKAANDKSFLPKIDPNSTVKPFSIDDANKVAQVWQSNRTPVAEVQTQPAEKPAETPKLIFDAKAERWRDPESGKFAVSPTKSSHGILNAVASTNLLKNTGIQKFAEWSLNRKETEAQKQSLEEQKRPSTTSTNPVTIQNARQNPNGVNAESKEDEEDKFDKMITILEKIEKNTSGLSGKKDDDKDKKKSEGLWATIGKSLKGLLTGGLMALAGRFTKIFGPLKTMLSGLLKLAKPIIDGLKNILAKLGGMVMSGVTAVAGGIKKGFETAKNKIFGKTAAAKAGTEVAETAAETAGKTAAKTAGKEAAEAVGKKSIAKAVGKTALKAIPGIGLIAGAAFGIERLMRGDYSGAAMEVASGAMGATGVGVAGSVAASGALAVRDMKFAEEAAPIEQKMRETGIITVSEKAKLKLANIDIPDGVEIIDDVQQPSTVSTEAKEAPQAAPTPSKVEPVPVSRTAKQMEEMQRQTEEADKLSKETDKSSRGSTIVNNITNNNSNSSNGSNNSGRIFARNPESTLEKWLSSRFVFQ